MTLRVLWSLAQGRRKGLRTLAICVANVTNMTNEARKKMDWEQYHRTGAFTERRQRPISPLVQAELDKITANGGRFVAE